MKTTLSIVLQCVLAVAILLMIVDFKPKIESIQDINVYDKQAINLLTAQTKLNGNFQAQYPPLTTSLFVLIKVTPFADTFGQKYLLWIIASIALLYAFLLHVCTSKAGIILLLSLSLSCMLLTQEMVLSRIDIFIGLLVLAAYVAQSKQRIFLSSFLIMLAAQLKIIPIVMLPVLFFSIDASKRDRLYIGALSSLYVGFIISISVLGLPSLIQNIGSFIGYQGGRGIQIETVWSGFLLLYQKIAGIEHQIYFDRMSIANGGFSNTATVLIKVIFPLSILAGTYLLYRLKKNLKSLDPFYPILFMFLVAIITMNVLSTQFLVWIIPLMLYWFLAHSMEKRTVSNLEIITGLLTVICSYTTAYPTIFRSSLLTPSITAVTMLTIRNITLCILAVFMYRAMVGKYKISHGGI